MKKILCICLSSTIQKSINFNNIQLENVNRSTSYRMDASGKAVNSARVLSQLEKNCVTVICPLGKKNKSLFVELAKKDNLKLKYVTIPGFTRECWTLLDRQKNTTTELVAGEPSFNFNIQKQERKLLTLIKKQIKKFDAVLFAGSRPNYFSENIICKIAELAIKNNKVFLADYHGKDLLNTISCCTPTIIKINEEEFLETFEYKDFSEEQLKEKIIQKSVELQNIVVVTRGVKSTFASEKGKFKEYPVEKIIPVNTTACGDSFSAGFLYEFLNSDDLSKSLEKANWCAARNAESQVPGSIKN